MKKDDLIKQDEKIHFHRVWLLLQIKDFIIERGINAWNVYKPTELEFMDYITRGMKSFLKSPF